MIQIDGKSYNIGIVSITRSTERIYKYNVTTEDGTRHTETRATYPVYDIVIGSTKQTEYDALHAACFTADETHLVTVPDDQGDITFEATLTLSGDSISFIESNGTRRWDNLTLTVKGVTSL